jgi:hypothetical protein
MSFKEWSATLEQKKNEMAKRVSDKKWFINI